MGVRTVVVGAVAVATLLAGCTGGGTLDDGSADVPDGDQETAAAVAVEPPEVGLCRALAREDLDSPTDDSPAVDCAEPHTAETFHVGEVDGDLAEDLSPDDPAVAAEVYRTCQKRWTKFTGANETLALRSVFSWAWFHPTEEQWAAGARWYRCDVVAGLDRAEGLLPLPRKTKGVLLGIPPDKWMTCVADQTVQDAPVVPCNEEHTWRAVSTIVVPRKKYPGRRLMEVLSRDYCAKSVIAWLDYPPQYDYAYTYFGPAEWAAGNKRAVCWARTSA